MPGGLGEFPASSGKSNEDYSIDIQGRTNHGLHVRSRRRSLHSPSTLEALPTVYEPPPVHVEREESEAKFWLDPVRLERSRGFSRTELRRMEVLVGENGTFLVRAWHEYFGN